jgi:hypothetical protein
MVYYIPTLHCSKLFLLLGFVRSLCQIPTPIHPFFCASATDRILLGVHGAGMICVAGPASLLTVLIRILELLGVFQNLKVASP